MSQQYPGGFITKDAPTVTTTSARGIWTLEQQAQYQRAGNWPLPPVLTTVTFPGGTSTWTAPATVSSIQTGVGKGADGSAGYFTTASVTTFIQTTTSSGFVWPNSPPIPTVNDTCGPAILSYINGLSPTLQNIAGLSFSPCREIDYDTVSNTWRETFLIPATTYTADWFSGGWVVGGTATLGQITGASYGVSYQSYVFPFTGAATTAFGYTWPGGVQAPAPTTTFNNIPVTPGATYTIVNNGSLTIQFYA